MFFAAWKHVRGDAFGERRFTDNYMHHDAIEEKIRSPLSALLNFFLTFSSLLKTDVSANR